MAIISKKGKLYLTKAQDELSPARIVDLKSIIRALEVHTNTLSDILNKKKNVYTDVFEMKTEEITKEIEANAKELLNVCAKIRKPWNSR